MDLIHLFSREWKWTIKKAFDTRNCGNITRTLNKNGLTNAAEIKCELYALKNRKVSGMEGYKGQYCDAISVIM